MLMTQKNLEREMFRAQASTCLPDENVGAPVLHLGKAERCQTRKWRAMSTGEMAFSMRRVLDEHVTQDCLADAV